jgi:hypothetical protein
MLIPTVNEWLSSGWDGWSPWTKSSQVSSSCVYLPPFSAYAMKEKG